MQAPITQDLAVVVTIDAFMWLIGVPPTLYYALWRGHLPSIGGIRLLGEPFEKLGLEALIVGGSVRSRSTP